ncbi:MAG TPA: 2-iminoacetate synthase ThiH [Polyangia bacterium]
MTFETEWRKHDFRAVVDSIAKKNAADVGRALGRGRGSLSLDDLAALLSPAAAPFLEEMAQTSHRHTVARFGRTMQLYAPLYLSNVCSNICSYCGFSAENRVERLILDDEAVLAEAAELAGMGMQHILLLTGESPRVGTDYLVHALRLLRPHFASLSFEVQPLDVYDYLRFGREGMNAVMVYQETYDPVAYARHHLRGPKANMGYRLETPDRLGQAGVKKIGIGALYGLSDWRAEAWFVGLHLRYLEKCYWRARTSISFPRLRPHKGDEGMALATFGERDLVQTICAFRLFSQEVELSLSTRESARFRNSAFRLGITAMSAGSRTNPGGYAHTQASLEQFTVDDSRSPAEVAGFLRAQGYEPVWKDWDGTYDGQVVGRATPQVPAC